MTNVKKEEINKLNICYNFTLKFPEKNDDKENNNPIFKLITSFNEIKTFDSKSPDYLKFLYFNRIKIHQLLYTEDETLTINVDDINDNGINSFFYLALLIEENTNLVNYIYSFNLIKKVNDMQDKENDGKIKKILLAKIILVLISNYKCAEFEEKVNEDDIETILKSNTDNITENEETIQKYDLETKDIFQLKLEKIYEKIIKKLIMENKWNKTEYIDNIINQIDLKSINLTKIMFDELYEVIQSNGDYLRDYLFSEYEDLFNEKKLTFYYFLFLYILKCQIYIFQIPFLLKTRKKIKQILNKNIEKFNKSIEQNKNNKIIKDVLTTFIEYEFYLNKSLTKQQQNSSNNPSGSNINLNRSGINNYPYNQNNYSISSMNGSGYFSGNSFNNAKQNSGRSLNKFEDEDNAPKTLTYREFCEKYNSQDAFKILQNSKFLINVSRNDNEVVFNYKQIKVGEETKDIENINKNISKMDEILKNNYKKFLKVLKIIEKKIVGEYKQNYNFDLEIHFTSDSFYKKEIIKLSCKYSLKKENDNELHEYEDSNILVEDIKNGNGIGYLIEEINIKEY